RTPALIKTVMAAALVVHFIFQGLAKVGVAFIRGAVKTDSSSFSRWRISVWARHPRPATFLLLRPRGLRPCRDSPVFRKLIWACLRNSFLWPQSTTREQFPSARFRAT